ADPRAAAPEADTAAGEAEPEPEGLELPTRFQTGEPGARPGIDLAELAAMPAGEPSPVTCIDYGPGRFEVRKIEDLEDFIIHRRADWVTVRWINVDGLDPAVIRALAIKYGVHPLAIEDLFQTDQRPKFDSFEGRDDRDVSLFLIVRMIQLVGDVLESEQISIFVGKNTVLTFQQSPGDIWDPIRQRIARDTSRMRHQDASYLLYALLDAIVDHCYPVLEHYGDRLEDLEELVLEQPDRKTIKQVHRLKRDLLLLRRAVWPMREVINGLQREPLACISDMTRTFLRDVYDHAVQIMDIIETYREVATSLTETYMTSTSNRLNEVMKVLTIIGTIFIPLTFLAGVYGMNMPIPENQWAASYPVFWGICLAVAGGMLYLFRRRDWL
ncbi:MAG: magnesium/cobalt transporter CorA, partial [Thermoanaerobaculia bacterium]